MPTVKLHYDGWICLPASLCQALGLSQGDRLTAELADGALVLQPVVRRKPRVPLPSRMRLRSAVKPCPPGASRAGRGRMLLLRLAPSAPTKKHGRPPKAVVTPEPEPAAEPVVRREPWILRKKADLPPAAPVVDKPAPPERRPEWRSDGGFPFVERRPFRHVEVRKLGPGRGITDRSP